MRLPCGEALHIVEVTVTGGLKRDLDAGGAGEADKIGGDRGGDRGGQANGGLRQERGELRKTLIFNRLGDDRVDGISWKKGAEAIWKRSIAIGMAYIR